MRAPRTLRVLFPLVFALTLALLGVTLVATAAAGAQAGSATGEPAGDPETGFPHPGGEAALGHFSYDDFAEPELCATCHADIARQYEEAMMSVCFTHEWDEIEYFDLALPHARKVAKVAGVEAGCNGCHAPLAFLAGDIPPARPAENTRANESVSCDLCHTMVGFEGDTPYNFNYVVDPGDVKRGPRGRTAAGHETEASDFQKSADLCGTCHNEKSPFGTWVKSTHLEWKDSPYGEANIVCQDCHMPPAPGRSALMGEDLPDVRQHLFHGAHDTAKLAGVVEVRMHPEEREVKAGGKVRVNAVLVNGKAGHQVPSGSAEERLLWLHVVATDGAGNTWHLPVDAKGFDGEEYTIASADALAYQDIGDIQGIEGFEGLKRDGQVPAGDRIYRLPYFDPQGRMTISQWNTASLGTDYRLAPLQAKRESFTWTLPDGVSPGEVTFTGTVYYSRLVSSVGEFLGVPPEEWEAVEVSSHSTKITVEERKKG